jgi:hypothetical protein
MAFLLSLFFSGMVVIGLYRVVTRADDRRKLTKGIKEAPIKALFTLAWVACWMAFFWGIFVPPLGQLPFFGLQLWQVGGLGSLIGLILLFAFPRLDT